VRRHCGQPERSDRANQENLMVRGKITQAAVTAPSKTTGSATPAGLHQDGAAVFVADGHGRLVSSRRMMWLIKRPT